MKKKRIICMTMALACCVSLTGCVDAMPDMTEEQQALVAEYAADIILKHSKYYDDGLADLSELDELEETEETSEEPQPELIEEEPEDDISEEFAMSEEEQGEGDITEFSDISFSEALGIEDVDIIFEQFMITDAYPEDSNAAFFINAPQGRNMLVMYFNLDNLSDEAVDCDIASLEPVIYVSVNGEKTNKAMSTELLLDDFTTYRGEIPAGDKVSLVVVSQVDEDMTVDDVQNINMRVELKDGTFNTNLYQAE